MSRRTRQQARRAPSPAADGAPLRFRGGPSPLDSGSRFPAAAMSCSTPATPQTRRFLAILKISGAELINHHGAAALLTILPGSDRVLQQYVDEAKTWSTVTPVILPGYDDPDHLRRKLKGGRDAETQKRYLARLDARMAELLRKAFRQAGFSSELLDHAETQLDWRPVGFRAGVDSASRYLPPENLNHAPRIHVRIRFPIPVRGPIVIGSGRFRGFGLFAMSE